MRTYLIGTSALVFVSVVALVGYQLLWPGYNATLDLLPNPPLNQLERQVAVRIEAYRLRVQKSPESSLAWGKLGMVLDVHELKQEAMVCYREAADLNPREFLWAYYGAIALREMGSPEAGEWFLRSRKIRADYAPLHVLSGQIYLDQQKFEEATEAFERALAIDPGLLHAYHGLATVALARQDLETSRAYLLQAIERRPSYTEAHGLLADVYRRLGDPEQAERELLYSKQLPQFTPMPDQIYTKLAAEGVSAWWYRRRGLAYLASGHYEIAVKEFRLRLLLKPDSQGHNNLGMALQRLGRRDEALEQFQAAVASDPDNPDAQNNFAGILFEQGKRSEAIALIERVIKLNPNSPGAYLNLGAFHMLAGRPAEAVRIFRQGYQQIPHHVQLASRLAWILATSKHDHLRDTIHALKIAYRNCQMTNFLLPEPLDVLAAAQASSGQFKEAVETARKALELTKPQAKRFLLERRARLSLYESGKVYRE